MDSVPKLAPTPSAVALVNEAFVRTHLDGRDALGMILRRDVVRMSNVASREQRTLLVVGIVEDVVQARAEDLRQSLGQWDMRPDGVVPIRDRMAFTQITPLFRTMLLGSFAGVALLVAAVGLFGAMAHMVRRRQRELGVRIALGADRASVLRMVMGQGMGLSAAGLLIGLGATLAMGRVLESFLLAMEPHDPITLIAVASVLMFVCAAACLMPACKATAVDPASVLQSE